MLRTSLFLCYGALVHVVESVKISSFKTEQFADAHLTTAPMEYYGNFVSCGGNTFLLTRVEKPEPIGPYFKIPWTVRVRLVLNGTNMSEPIELRRTEIMHHNIAGLCVDGTVYLIGGQYRTDRNESHFQGVFMSTTSPTSLTTFANDATTPRLVFKGSHPGCTEHRPPQPNRPKMEGNCEFDGQFRVVRWQGQYHVYARANTPQRHVQVTSTSDWHSWSDFRMINISNVNHHNQIYFLHAEPWNATHMIGVFPGVVKFTRPSGRGMMKGSGIFVMWSQNGFDWTEPVLIKKDTAKDGVHVPWTPVGFLDGHLMIMKRTALSSTSYTACTHEGLDTDCNLRSMATNTVFQQQLDIVTLPRSAFAL